MPKIRSIADAIRLEFEPLLRSRDFDGKYPHYRRIVADKAELISFQTDKYGGSFTIEIAQGPAEGYQAKSQDEFTPYNELDAFTINPDDRRERVRTGIFGYDEWFYYDRLWQKVFLKKPDRLRFAARSAAKKISAIDRQFQKWHNNQR